MKAILKRIKAYFYDPDVGFDPRKLTTFIQPLGADLPTDAESIPMNSCIERFLADTQAQTLLIQGGPGSGKSLLSQITAHGLWQQNIEEMIIVPLWVWLPTLIKAAEGKDLIHCVLRAHGLMSEEIDAFQQACQTDTLKPLLILDGWDEVPVLQTNLLVENDWFGARWPHMKLLVTSRPEILTQYRDGYRRFFCGGEEVGLQFQELYLQPFNQEQISHYIEVFISQCQQDTQYQVADIPSSLMDNHTICTSSMVSSDPLFLYWQEPQLYSKALTSLPGLQHLCETPFVLTLLIQVLPRILLDKSHASEISEEGQEKAITHYKLYTYFVDEWLAQQVERLLGNQEIKDFFNRYLQLPETATSDENLEYSLKKRLKACLHTYSENLARAAFNQQDDTLNVLLDNSITLNPDLLYAANRQPYFYERLDKKNKRQALEYVRSGCLLRGQHSLVDDTISHTFLHKSILEFFAAYNIKHGVCTAIDWYTNSLVEGEVIQSEFSLNDRLLNQEPNVIRFLADKVRDNPGFKQLLYQVIEFSKQTPVVATASANAFTILNAAGEVFNGMDFSKARLPGAILTGAIAQGANFVNADCCEVDFTNAWLRDADFTGAYLKNVEFGQLPNIEVDIPIVSHALSPDVKWLALGSIEGDIIIYETENDKIYFQYKLPMSFFPKMVGRYRYLLVNSESGLFQRMTCPSTLTLAFSQDSTVLYAITWEYHVYSINLEAKSITSHFSHATGRQIDFKFSAELAEQFFNYWLQRDFGAYGFLLKDPAFDALVYRNQTSKTYHYWTLSGKFLGEVFEGEDVMTVSHDGTCLLNFHEETKEQRLYSIKDGIINRQLIKAHKASDKPWFIELRSGYVDLNEHVPKQYTAAISRDHNYWAVLCKEGIFFNYSIKIITVASSSEKKLDIFKLHNPVSININFAQSSKELITVLSPGAVTLWHWPSGKILAKCAQKEVRYPFLEVLPKTNQWLLLNLAQQQISRYNSNLKNKVLEFRANKNILPFIEMTSPQSKITILPLENQSLEATYNDTYTFRLPNVNNVCADKAATFCYTSNLAGRHAMCQRYFAIANGYWTSSQTEIIGRHQLYQRSNFFGLLSSMIAKAIITEHEKLIEDISISLVAVEKGGGTINLPNERPVVALTFSPKGEYLATVDALFYVQLWQLPQCKVTPDLLEEKVRKIGPLLHLPDSAKFRNCKLKVDNSGIIFINCNTMIFILDQRKKLFSSYNLGINLSNFVIRHDALVCYGKDNSVIDFKLEKTKTRHYSLILTWSSRLLPLQLEGAKFSQTIGLTPLQENLIKELNVSGLPLGFTSNNSNSVLDACFALSNFMVRLKDSIATITDQFYSQLHPMSPLVNYNNWVVALVRDDEAKDSRHTFLIIEGLNSFGKAFYLRMELYTHAQVTDTEDGQTIKHTIRVKDGFAKIRTVPLLGDGKPMLADDLSEKALSVQLEQVLRRPKNTLLGQAWVVRREKLVELYEHVLEQVRLQTEDEKYFIPYSFMGERGFFSQKKHNCYTWARELLLRLREPKIANSLPTGWVEYIAANPGSKLNTRLQSVPQESHQSTVSCTTTQSSLLLDSQIRRCCMM